MDYGYWERGLAITGGKRPLTRDEMRELGLTHEPGCGFFQRRNHATRLIKDDSYTPCAIWGSDGYLVAVCGGLEVDAEEIWVAACGYPITETAYREATEHLS